MTKNVSVEGVSDIANELKKIADTLNEDYDSIVSTINKINDDINVLKSYNGKDASTSPYPYEIKDFSLISAYTKQYYKYIWDIDISNEDSVSSVLSNSLFKELEENINLLDLNSSDLNLLATVLYNLITSISSSLAVDFNGSAVDFFNSIKNNEDWINYLTTKIIDYKDIFTDGFTPQGITEVGSYLLISAYKSGNYSRVYFYNKYTSEYEGVIILDNKAHVGGISYDKDNNILFVTGSKGSVNAYNYEMIEEAIELKEKLTGSSAFEIDFNANSTNENYDFKIDSDININLSSDTDYKAATTYYYDNKLYIGSFSGLGAGTLTSYSLNYDKVNNKIITSNAMTSSLPSATQGIAVSEYNDTTYLLSTQSVGFSSSKVTLSKINGNTIEYIGVKYIDNGGIEGINIDNDGNVVAIFEKGDTKTLSTSIEALENSLDSYDFNKELIMGVNGAGYEIEHSEIGQKAKELLESINKGD